VHIDRLLCFERELYILRSLPESTIGEPPRCLEPVSHARAMRHTFATDVLDATDGDLYAVKELLGHSSTRVTEVYLHSSRTRTVSATDALAVYRGAKREDGSR
jgi:integrase